MWISRQAPLHVPSCCYWCRLPSPRATPRPLFFCLILSADEAVIMLTAAISLCCFVVDARKFLPQPDKLYSVSHKSTPPSCRQSSNVFDSAHRIGKMWSPSLFPDSLWLVTDRRTDGRASSYVVSCLMVRYTAVRTWNSVRSVLHCTSHSHYCPPAAGANLLSQKNQSHLITTHHSQELFVACC